jgi:hypothetical protein
MAVTFTSNIGLAKPTESELALEWARISELAEDNNAIIEDKTDIVFTSYTPTIIGSTTNPNVGAGSISGEYFEHEGWIWGSFAVLFLTPGISAGSGTGAYGITLPFPADGSFHTVGTSLSDQPGLISCIGEGHIIDNTVANGGTVALDTVTIAGTGYARLITETFAGKTAAFVNPANPVVVDTNDRWSASFFYKKA